MRVYSKWKSASKVAAENYNEESLWIFTEKVIIIYLICYIDGLVPGRQTVIITIQIQ